MTTNHHIYGLAFQILDDSDPIIFYVGRTTDLTRRGHEHQRNQFLVDHPEYNTDKYIFSRELAEQGINMFMVVLHRNVQIDTDSEYYYVLKQARLNEQQGIEFYRGQPLTNMKAGDLLAEMLADKTVNTLEDVKKFVSAHNAKKSAKYDGKHPENSKILHVIRGFEQDAAESRAEYARIEKRRLKREQAHQEMLASRERLDAIKRETAKLIELDKHRLRGK